MFTNIGSESDDKELFVIMSDVFDKPQYGDTISSYHGNSIISTIKAPEVMAHE
jgi:hypothetical protein